MAINSIDAVNSAQSILKTSNTQQEDKGFSNILSQALDYVKETEEESEAASEALLTGGSGDIHTALIASQKSEIAVSYAVEIRNKVVEAYDNVMNMQV